MNDIINNEIEIETEIDPKDEEIKRKDEEIEFLKRKVAALEEYQPQHHSTEINDLRFMAKAAKASALTPKEYRMSAQTCFMAIQMGKELGLKPMQSLTNIMVLHGKPCIYGDALPAIVLGSGLLEDYAEVYDPEKGGGTYTCSAKRKGINMAFIGEFSLNEAREAGLYKDNPSSAERAMPWYKYTKRMLKMRARAFCFRDGFADVLKGINVAEEVQDYVDLNAKEVKGVQTPQEPKKKQNLINNLLEDLKK